MAEEVLNLYQKLAKIRKMTEVIQKNKRGYNYKYTSIDEILARVTAGMEKYHVSLIPKFEQNSSGGGSEELAQQKTGYFTEVEIKEDKSQ